MHWLAIACNFNHPENPGAIVENAVIRSLGCTIYACNVMKTRRAVDLPLPTVLTAAVLFPKLSPGGKTVRSVRTEVKENDEARPSTKPAMQSFHFILVLPRQ